jgi:hypothetical protein
VQLVLEESKNIHRGGAKGHPGLEEEQREGKKEEVHVASATQVWKPRQKNIDKSSDSAHFRKKSAENQTLGITLLLRFLEANSAEFDRFSPNFAKLSSNRLIRPPPNFLSPPICVTLDDTR